MNFNITLTGLEDRDLETIEKTGTIKIPDGVTEIGEYAFWGLEYLTKIEIPGKVETIGKCAFDCCDNLEVVKIPKNVKKISHDAFRGCNRLKELRIEESAVPRFAGKIELPECTKIVAYEAEKTR